MLIVKVKEMPYIDKNGQCLKTLGLFSEFLRIVRKSNYFSHKQANVTNNF